MPRFLNIILKELSKEIKCPTDTTERPMFMLKCLPLMLMRNRLHLVAFHYCVSELQSQTYTEIRQLDVYSCKRGNVDSNLSIREWSLVKL